MTTRIILSVVLSAIYSFINFTIYNAAPLISSRTAVGQLTDSNETYFMAKAGTLFTGDGLPFIVLLIALGLVWIKPILSFIKDNASKVPVILIAATIALSGSSCHAYYDAKDQEEYVQIKANQTAFLVSQQGNNKQGQGSFDSAAYLSENKIAEKRIQIPHQLLKKYGFLGSNNMYIPSAVLYVVTREPFAREWAKEATRGTSNKDEGFYLESQEGINIDFNVAIGAHIEIKDAATFLFNFGTSTVINAGDNADFPSVVYARELKDVMDTVVHKRLWALLSKEFKSRTMINAITQAAESMTAAEKQLIEEYAKVGITIEYVGYASPLNFDPKIQEAINKVFLAQQEALAADSLMKAMPARQAVAEVSIKEGFAKAVEKWDGRVNLPNFVVIPQDMFGSVKGLFGGLTNPLSSPQQPHVPSASIAAPVGK